ncbi:MAG: DUF3990 domain-containing protein [Treponema sp.]|nr:DUF3990 domain-containing protein [Treponema sp.]
MLVYHGSNVAVEIPKILASNRALDFGGGFYVTTNLEQAKTFANNVVNRNEGWGVPTISSYEIDFDKTLRELKVLQFDRPNDLWLDFVHAHRTSQYSGELFDVIVGPVVNDTVYRVFRLFENGDIDREATIRRLKVAELYNQMAFRTERAIAALEFVGLMEGNNG